MHSSSSRHGIRKIILVTIAAVICLAWALGGYSRGLSPVNNPAIMTKGSSLVEKGSTTFADDTTSTLPLCEREVLRQGRWVKGEIPTAPYYPLDEFGQVSNCYGKGNWSSRTPWTTHFWRVPHHAGCQFLEWNGTQFCDMMQSQSIVIIGDSLSFELYLPLVLMLGGAGVRMNERLHGNRTILHTGCSGRIKIYYHRDDTLEKLPIVLKRTKPDVLILNRGAHYFNDSILIPQIRHTIQLLETYQQQRQHENECRIFWRTTAPGHPLCSRYSEPVNDILAMEALVANLSGYLWVVGGEDFSWWKFLEQNALILKEFEASNLTYDIIDGYDVMIRRPDLHYLPNIDCLHSCYPGKMDVYPQLLWHYLNMKPRYTKATAASLL
jgi:hypothetical protein